MQHQRLAQQDRHHSCRESNVAAQANHHMRLDTAYDLYALPEGLEQTQGQQSEGDRAFAAHTRKINGFKCESARRYQLAFHAWAGITALAAQPMHAPAFVAQGFGHSQARKDMTARAASHHESAALRHALPPLINNRFS